MPPLFTIGHSVHSIERFVELLRLHEVEAVADVRSSPYSSHVPHFSRERLQTRMKSDGFRYVFMGEQLGARRSEASAYVGASVDYGEVAKLPSFQAGLERLHEGTARMRIALLCAEHEPLECHRCLLVARHAKSFADVAHILGDGRLERHAQTEARMLARCGLANDDMFSPLEVRLDRAYRTLGKRIGFCVP